MGRDGDNILPYEKNYNGFGIDKTTFNLSTVDVITCDNSFDILQVGIPCTCIIGNINPKYEQFGLVVLFEVR